MPLETSVGMVTFRPDNATYPRVVLQLQGDLTISGGLDPDVVSAVLPATERAKLPVGYH